MRRGLRASTAAAIAAMSVGVAFAGTPLPDPPFAGGGFDPPTKDVLKQEDAVGRIAMRAFVGRAKCDRQAILDLELAYEPPGAAKVPAVQAAWASCVARVDLRYQRQRDRQLEKGTPACLDQTSIDALRAEADGTLATLSPTLYCDDGGASPDPVVGLDVPDKKKEASGEAEASKVVTKAWYNTVKCYAKGVGLVFGSGGVLEPGDVEKIGACVAKVSARAGGALADLDQTQKLPSCLPAATAEAVANVAVGAAAVLTDSIYCASPSGAFLDGAPTL